MNTHAGTGRMRQAAIKRTQKIMLVYQAGIANVFAVDCLNLNPYGRNARRLLQQAFSPCVWYARGLMAAGWTVKTVYCNRAGDITDAQWSEDENDCPFRDSVSFAMVDSDRG